MTDNRDAWIEERVNAARTFFDVPEKVSAAYKMLLSEKLQTPLKPAELREVVRLLATTNSEES